MFIGDLFEIRGNFYGGRVRLSVGPNIRLDWHDVTE